MCQIPPVALLLVGLCAATIAAQPASAQSVDELMRENRQLLAQIASLEQQMAANGVLPTARRTAWRYDDDDFERIPREEANDGHGHHDHNGHGHDGHANGDACNSCDSCWCEPHFDCLLPFPDHHGGHGACDPCGCNSCNHEGHSHDGHEEHAYGPAYHHSVNGYPLLHSARTEFFFIERHVHIRLADVRGADGGQADELELEAELVYALNDRWVLIGTVPYASVNPMAGPSTDGFGDLKFGIRMIGYNGRYDGLLFGLDITTPTGDPDRDLGMGNTVLAPSVNWMHDYGQGTYLANVLTWEMGVDVDTPSDVVLHDFVFLHTFLGTADARHFRYFTPSIEFNTEATINGADSGRTVVDLTLGATWVVGEENEMAIGWSTPLTGDKNFDHLLLFNFIKHL